MADFWDLPRPVRDKIYRMHLVQEAPITVTEHRKFIKFRSTKSMPKIFEVSRQAEREAAKIYYGENHFDLEFSFGVRRLVESTWPRHINLICRLTVPWGPPKCVHESYGRAGGTGEDFSRLASMKALEELNIRIDESDMLKHMSFTREIRQRLMLPDATGSNLTPQQHLAILRFPGMGGLLKLSKIENVNFVQLVGVNGDKYGGLLAGGPFETQILPRLKAPKLKPVKIKYVDSLDTPMIFVVDMMLISVQKRQGISIPRLAA